MANKDINIKISLIDDVSKGLETVNKGVHKFAMDLRSASREIGLIGRTMAFTGTAISAPLILAFKSAADYSMGVSEETKKLDAVFIGLRTTVAEAMLPAVREFTEILGKVYFAFEQIDPKIKETAVNSLLMGSAFLVLGGTILTIVGRLGQMSAALIDLPTKFIAFVQMHPIIIGIAGGIALVSVMLDKLGADGVTNLGKVQIAFYMSLQGCMLFTRGLMEAYKWSQRLQLNYFGQKQTQSFIDQINVSLNLLDTQIQGILSKGSATGFLGGFDDFNKAIEEMKRSLENMPDLNFEALIQKWKDAKMQIETEVKTLKDVMVDTMKQTAEAMGQSMGNFFGSVLKGQVRSAKQFFIDFGGQILDILGQVIAKLIITQTLGRAFGSFNLLGMAFHQGGVVRAHNGLNTDEVPIIAQKGEGIISRRGMAALGSYGFNKINSGQVSGAGGGGVTVNPTIVIQAWDASDIYRNKEMISNLIVNSITRNSVVRQSLKANL